MVAEAIEVFKKIITSNPENHDTRYNLAFAYSQKGQYNEAAATCEKLLELKPGDANVHLLLSDTYSKLGKTREAQEEYETYKKLIFIK